MPFRSDSRPDARPARPGARRDARPLSERPLPLLLAAAAACTAAGAAAGAQDAGAEPAAGASPPSQRIVISATRVESGEDEVAATVSTVGAEDIERRGAVDLRDLLRQEAGVAVRALPNRASAVFYGTGRGGNEGINIRGLEGNQVMLQVDGVRLPMLYASGPFFAGRGNYVDVEAFKRVELLRGPSSASYGSDGLAGAVSFVTKDASDFLRPGETAGGALKLGYRGNDDSRVAVPAFAWRADGGTEALLLASLRRGHEPANEGDDHSRDQTRTAPNPQHTRSHYLLAKLEQPLSPRHRLKFGIEHLSRRADAEIYTLFGDPLYTNATSVLTDVEVGERVERTLLKAGWHFADPRAAGFQKIDATLYRQDTADRQFGHEARTTSLATGWTRRDRDTRYAEEAVGGSVQFESNFGTAVAQRLIWGLDASTTDVSLLRGGVNVRDGVPIATGPGAFVVNKGFPDTEYRLVGAFVQDEIRHGRLTVIPALRWDRFELDPRRGDPAYAVNNATPPVSLTGDELSPRLGLIWRFTPALRGVANLAHGFRAPTPAQVNGGVTNLVSTPAYRSVGNPDLKPETSDTVELGLRGEHGALRWTATVFESRYEDFIATDVPVGGSGSVADPVVRQSVNLSRVEIRGVEAGVDWAVARGWRLSARYAHARGDSRQDGVDEPLDTIEPDKVVLALKRDAGRWGGEFSVVAMRRQDRHTEPDAGEQYVPGGFAVVDLSAWWRVGPDTELVVGVANLFDKRYVHWADARELTTASPVIDAYTQPGRQLDASVRYRF